VPFILSGMKQAIIDVRRGKDAVACLPLVQKDVVGIQGTSLGGFVTATVAGLDRGYGRVFVLPMIIQEIGQKINDRPEVDTPSE